MTVAAIVPVTARGEVLLDGAPLLVHAVDQLTGAASIDTVVVAAPAADVDAVRRRLDASSRVADIVVVAGGNSRPDLVRGALARLPAEVDVVVVHDPARALAPSFLVQDVVRAVRAGADAAVPADAVVETVKALGADDAVLATVPRERLRTVQSPQAFRRAVLADVYDAAADEPGEQRDELALVAGAAYKVVVVPGSDEAFLVDRRAHLHLAEALLARRRSSAQWSAGSSPRTRRSSGRTSS